MLGKQGWSVEITTPAAMQRLGTAFSAFFRPGDVILLEGALGAGKTTFTKGLAKGLGIAVSIKSPTYTLIREYTQGRLPLYHMDAYRLETTGGGDLGLEEYLYGQGVSVIEWAQFVPEDLPEHVLTIHIDVTGADFSKRHLFFSPSGSRLLAAVRQQYERNKRRNDTRED